MNQQRSDDTLKLAPTMDAHTLTAALNLNEQFLESLQNSTAEEAEFEEDTNGKDHTQDNNTIYILLRENNCHMEVCFNRLILLELRTVA